MIVGVIIASVVTVMLSDEAQPSALLTLTGIITVYMLYFLTQQEHGTVNSLYLTWRRHCTILIKNFSVKVLPEAVFSTTNDLFG